MSNNNNFGKEDKLNEIKNIKNKIEEEKTNNNEKIFNSSNILNITRSYSRWGLDNTFTIINFDGISYIIYATINKSIISYNINDEKISIEIKNAHQDDITNFRHFHKKNTNKFIIMSVEGYERNIKLWDFMNWNCILSLSSIYRTGLIFSSCFIEENDKNYIITSCSSENEEIKIFDFSGIFIKSLKDSKEKTLYVDILFLKKNDKLYIISGNDGNVKSYDYYDNKLYHTYNDHADSWHCSIKTLYEGARVKLIDSCWKDDYIRIWDFNEGILLNKIRTNGINIKCMYIYNEDIIFVGCHDNSIRLIDIKNEKIIKTFLGHKNWVCSINKVTLPKNGECLISQGLGKDEMIKIWIGFFKWK